EPPAEPVEGAGAVLGEEVASNGLRRGGRGGRGHAEPHPVALGARLRHAVPRALHRQAPGSCPLPLTEKYGAASNRSYRPGQRLRCRGSKFVSRTGGGGSNAKSRSENV